jgi:putative transposase
MMKNKHLSKDIGDLGFFRFRRYMEYKCNLNGITFIAADRYFPSSKTCSYCGRIKKDLKLSDRIYECECGVSIDRDFNAARNLAKYGLSRPR